MSEKEFEEGQLTKLTNDLKDINSYKSFRNGSFIYDLGHYQGLLLVNEIERLNNIIKEVKEYIYNKEIDTLHFNSKDFLDTSIATELLEILDKGINDER